MSEQQRRKRHERDPHPPPMQLTERDIRILEMVYQCRVLRQDQLHTLFFHGAKSASQYRLMLLYQHGFLARRFLTVHASYLLSQALYLIDRRGIETLRTQRGMDALHWTAHDVQVGQQFLEHTLAINDVRVAALLACRQLGYPLLDWQGESDLKTNAERVRIRDSVGRLVTVSFIPDSYFAIDTPESTGHFFLELDRGTMTTKRFADKIAAYLMYYQSGAYERRYHTKSLRVLTITLSATRLKNLKQATEAAGGGTRFWFGLLSDISPESILHTPMWSAANKDEQFALFSQSPSSTQP